jgi:hypothetical protein
VNKFVEDRLWMNVSDYARTGANRPSITHEAQLVLRTGTEFVTFHCKPIYARASTDNVVYLFYNREFDFYRRSTSLANSPSVRLFVFTAKAAKDRAIPIWPATYPVRYHGSFEARHENRHDDVCKPGWPQDLTAYISTLSTLPDYVG